MERNFEGFVKDKNEFMAIERKPAATIDILPAGVYSTNVDFIGRLFFKEIVTNYDEILDLPSKEYTHILNEMKTFMKPETKTLFDDFGFIYKRSCLLEGPPGTGKTVLINRVCEEVVNMGGVVLMNPEAEECREFFDVLDGTQPDILTLVVFEEFDNHFNDGECHSTDILSLLDGEIQKRNVMFLATTNFPDEISPRFKRPGRFSSVITMKAPTTDARYAFLKHKIGLDPMIDEWVEQTDGLTIDELKETVLAVKCLGQPLTPVVERLRALGGESNAS